MIIKIRIPSAAVLFSVLRDSYSNNRLLNVLLIYDKEHVLSLRIQAYSNILKFYHQKNESFQVKILIFFIFLLKT